ncbi:sarcosine oxidase subunit delta [Hyphomicrobium sp.]|jgi:sarcosine oxidase subunit delta|uniref:sarcosine oxidase subunit delta n=1 Tax=Hyphomicrobium sp. TaxID=82 RepID=UPI000F98EF5E|nr:sarcosine oxidase subunit delta [Hyphomicrobium sp.]RUO98696.1 MAG: sarcosine oxidase subunit delta [Hyphomicrobium sp.]
MRIKCPYCGERGNDEFSYLGDASVKRPDPSAADASDAFYAFAYERKNVAGPMQELWYHAAGCHAWLVVTRDTRTHEISDVKPAQDVALEQQKTASAP